MLSEKQKMLTGQYYTPWDDELTAEREFAKDLLFELNQIAPSKRDARNALIKQLIPGVVDGVWIESPFGCDYGYNIKLGKNFYANTNCTLLDCAEIVIGDDVLFGPNVSLYTVNHAMDAAERKAGFEYAKQIVIGDNVWVSGSVTIVGGVTIGNNSVIAAGSVVTKDIPGNALAAGVPCRVLREITDADRQGLIK